MNLDLTDPRTQRALLIAADAGQWMRCHTPGGEVAYGIPSAKIDSRYYLVTAHSCDCEDFKRHGLRPGRIQETGGHVYCKHIRAVQLYEALVEAWSSLSRPARRRHLHLIGGTAS